MQQNAQVMHVTFFSYLKPRPLIATGNPPNQIKQHDASRQCDEAPGERVPASDNGLAYFRVAKGGVGFWLHLEITYLVF